METEPPYDRPPGSTAGAPQPDGLRAEVGASAEPGLSARYGELALRSAFQPILSAAHRRVVGHEALLRAVDERGLHVPAREVFQRPGTLVELLRLERLSRTLHFENFLRQLPVPQWLFVNVHPDVFPRIPAEDATFAELLRTARLAPGTLMVEVLEDVADDAIAVRDAAAFYREIGCGIAVDDFGIGHSNFDRIWALRPDIVKLDRSLAERASREREVRAVMPSLVSTLHEIGVRVLWEGMETADQIAMALDCGVDLVQGFALGRPAPTLAPYDSAASTLGSAWQAFHSRIRDDTETTEARLAPYRAAFARAQEAFTRGVPLREAFATFLALPDAMHSFVLDSDGNQFGPLLGPVGARADGAVWFNPLAGLPDANWAHRPHFRRALEFPDVIQVSRPYLSSDSGLTCVTFSVCTAQSGQPWVLCANRAWPGTVEPVSVSVPISLLDFPFDANG